MKCLAAALLIVATLATSSVVAQDSYGSNTPGAGGIAPSLFCGQAWMGNPAFGLNVSGALGGTTAVFGVSIQPASIFLGMTEILVDLNPANLILLTAVPVSGPIGTAGVGSAFLSLPLSFPVDPSVAGFIFYAQAVMSDNSLGSFASTRGLEVEIAMPPMVYVGTSVGGSNDPSWLIDPIGQSVIQSYTANVNNVTDAEFAHGGSRVYVGTSLGQAVMELDTGAATPSYSAFYNAGGVCYGIGYDRRNNIVYTLSDGPTGSRELIALDANLGSPTYGTVLSMTAGIGALGIVERWELSPSGRFAGVLTVLPAQLVIVDTDPSSPTWMQWNPLGLIPAGPSPFTLANNLVFTPRDEQILVVVQLAGPVPGEVARYDNLSGTWIDHDPFAPGIQNITGVNMPGAPVTIDIARSGQFAVVCGFSGNGAVARIDLNVAAPWACSISGDDTSVAVGSFGGAQSQVVLIDVLSGALLGTVPIPGASNVYTVKYH
jgi:hypothetical protein